MKTQEEIRSLIEAFRTVTKEVNRAIESGNSGDRMCVAMLLLPLLPAIDEFMKILKDEVKDAKEEKPSSEDPLDNFIHQIKPNGTIS